MNEFQLIKGLNDLGSDERMMVLGEIIAGLSHDQRRELREELCPPNSIAAGDHAPVEGTWSWALEQMRTGRWVTFGYGSWRIVIAGWKSRTPVFITSDSFVWLPEIFDRTDWRIADEPAHDEGKELM